MRTYLLGIIAAASFICIFICAFFAIKTTGLEANLWTIGCVFFTALFSKNIDRFFSRI